MPPEATPDSLDLDSDDIGNLYELTPEPAAPAMHQPTHYERTPSLGLGPGRPSMFSNRIQRSQGTILVPNSSRSASYPSSLQPPPCGQPWARSGYNSPRAGYYPSSLGFGHHNRQSTSESCSSAASHSREFSGSPNIPSTQGTDSLSHEILWIQDEYTELRDSQLRMMEHMLYLTQKVDKVSSDFYQYQKPSTHQPTIRWAKLTIHN